MKVAITAETGVGLDAQVAGHFGQTPYFVLAEIADGTIAATEVLANPFLAGHRPGEVPAFIRAHGANVILSGGMGIRAIHIFDAHDVTAVTGASGTVRRAVTDYLAGALAGASPCADSVKHHHGAPSHV
ncbi:MAG: dinitrogenase iron-molybdenum cofactor biosynthesis protein [Propionibacterium sp.]|nr:dinitrogenase iron-molybdenum cofactor biosynthesis protein [Propionibacterium sp.]